MGSSGINAGTWGSVKSAAEVKGAKFNEKMAQPTTTYRRVPTGSVNLRVPKLVGSKWVYEYPVSKAQQPQEPAPNQPREIPITNNSRNYAQEPPIERRNYSELSGYPRDMPVETPKPAEKPVREDWRGPWPHDNLGPKPRLVGGKLVKPKFIDY